MIARGPFGMGLGERFWKGGKWAVGIGVVVGAVACLAPLLVALGVGTAVVGAISMKGEIVAVALLVGGGAAGAYGFVRRLSSKRRAEAGTPARAGGCEDGCHIPGVARSAGASGAAADGGDSLACTLDGDGARVRMEEFRSVFRRAYIAGERFTGGVRWRFRSEPGLLAELRTLAAREQACCSFFHFEVFERAEEVWWQTMAQPGAEAVLEEFFVMPERLTQDASPSPAQLLTAVGSPPRPPGPGPTRPRPGSARQ
jgi:hypothetical protein